MEVSFKRTGARRYAVNLEIAGKPPQKMDPAPGFDEHIPHDLVHYVVEAELRLTSGVYGRAASGGGTFITAPGETLSSRERARAHRKQVRRESRLRSADEQSERAMQLSELLAGTCDLVWRRRHGQRPDPERWILDAPIAADIAPQVERVVARLDQLAPRWHRLPIGGELAFVWPSLEPIRG